MRYPSEWKGRVRVAANDDVFWDGVKVGAVRSRYKEGAHSTGGLLTNTVYVVVATGAEYPTKRDAIAAMIPKGAT